MFNKMLVITLGVTGLSSVLLFLYFRNRLSDVEKKVDTMFNLIQSYETVEKQPQFTMEETPREYYEQQQMQQEMHQQMQQQAEYHPNNELVQVSDRGEGDESSDSDDESESDSDDDYSSEEEETTKPLVVKSESEDVTLREEDVTTDLNEISLEKKPTQEEEVEEVEEEVTKNITLQSDELDLTTLKVSDLKNLCKEKGLSGYRNLRKNDLIELLSA